MPLAEVDAAGMEAVLNLAVDTPAAFYEQFGFRHVKGKYTKKRMLRPGVPSPRKRAVAPTTDRQWAIHFLRQNAETFEWAAR